LFVSFVGLAVTALASAVAYFWWQRRGRRAACVAAAVAAVFVGFWVSQSVPGVATAIPRGRQKETVHRMVQIAQAMGKPEVRRLRPTNIANLAKLTHSALKSEDGWGNPFHFQTVISPALTHWPK
jgi:hypothetical protein